MHFELVMREDDAEIGATYRDLGATELQATPREDRRVPGPLGRGGLVARRRAGGGPDAGPRKSRTMDGEAIPAPIQEGIRAAAIEPFSLLIACRILVEDMSESGHEARYAEGRLERAVARATLDAWLHGLGSAMSVGLAYAAVGNCVRRTLHGA
jgi:hypothetical protein